MFILENFSAITSNAKVGVAQVIGFVAYFAPYFAIAFAARMATGIIGQLAGVVNDRHRGLFDRTKNIRGKAMQQNMSNMTAGTRFNNGALNRITARATTRNLGLGRQGRAAYKNKMELQAEHFAQTDGAKATRWDDNINRAATYVSAAEAQRRMGADFGITDPNEVREAIAGVRASGGFGEARRRQAIQALIGSKTGFENIQQAYQTAARVGSNQNEVEALGSAIHAGSAANGRHDLAPGAGRAAEIARTLSQGGAINWDAETMRALEGVDMVSFIRDKPAQTVQYVTEALNRQVNTDAGILQAPAGAYTYAQTEQARERFLRNTGVMDQMDGAKGYAPPVSQTHINNMVNRARRDGNLSDPNALTQYIDATGAVVTPAPGTAPLPEWGQRRQASLLDQLTGKDTTVAPPTITAEDRTTVVSPAGAPVVYAQRRIVAPGYAAPAASPIQKQNKDIYDQSRTPRYDPNNPNNA